MTPRGASNRFTRKSRALMADTPREVDFIPITDVLGRHAWLPHVSERRVLGVPVVCRSNSRYVCERFETAFSIAQHEECAAARTLTLRVVIGSGTEYVAPPIPVRAIAVDAARILLQSPGSVACIDPDRREAVAYVTEQ